MKNFLRGWRTLFINGIAMAIAALDVILSVAGSPEFRAILPAGVAPYLAALSAINFALRLDTRTAPGRKS